MSSLSRITAIKEGSGHSLALKNDSTVWAWGYNELGQLGNGTYNNSNVALQVSPLSGITAIAIGNWYSFALQNDSTYWAWGDNSWGQFGNGSGIGTISPVQVTGPCQTLTGMEEVNSSSTINIFPNPATNQLTIDNGKWKIESVAIYDVTGREVYSENHQTPNSKSQTLLDVSNFPEGVYVVRIQTTEFNETKKLIVAK